MKTFYSSLVAFFFSAMLCAQTFHPIPESDAVWIQGSFLYFFNNHEHTTITNSLSFGQDTVIGAEVYHTLQGHEIVQWVDGWGQQNYTTETYTTESPKVYFRQDIPGKKVYTFSENQDTLLYDFNLSVGQIYPQTVTNINYPNLLVMGQDSVQLLDGLYHKRWQLGTNSIDSAYISIIEGVGATSGFNLIMFPQFEQSSDIMCMKVMENQLYDGWANNSPIIPAKYSEDCAKNVSIKEIDPSNGDIKIWPNPCADLLTIRDNSERALHSIRISDVFGNTILEFNAISEEHRIDFSNYAKGTYFIDVIRFNQERTIQKIIIN